MKQTSRKLKSERKIPLPVEKTSYKKMSNGCYYVDKTLLICDLIDDHNNVTLFARPHGFGKTAVLDMLQTYFEKTDNDTSCYFNDKAIWACNEEYRKHQGAYPVITLTFQNAKCNSWQETYRSIQLAVKREYERHKCMLNDHNLEFDDRDYFERMENGTLSDVEFSRSLGNLTRILSAYYQCKTVILIDDYDAPIQQGLYCDFYDKITSFLWVFLSCGLKDNPHSAFGVLTGVMPFSKEISSAVNNISINTIVNTKYSNYFGSFC